MKSFLISEAVAVIVIAIIGSLLQQPPSHFWEILFFVAVTTTFLFVYLYRIGPDYFIKFYLATIVIKLLAYGGFSAFLILHQRSEAAANVAFLLISYLVFTTLELAFLYPKINR